MEYDYHKLDHMLDIAKSDLFLTKYASFYGSLLCSLNFSWTERIPTAATNGIDLLWNPKDFLKLNAGNRKSTLRHEVEHNARLHHDRRGNRDPKVWNIACDYRINNDMQLEGYEMDSKEFLLDHKRFPPGMPEEDIYDELMKNVRYIQLPEGWSPDMISEDHNGLPLSAPDKARTLNIVVRAAQQAKLGGAGNMPGDIEKMLTRFLTPVVPWEQYVHRFFTDLIEDGYTWSKPNRRYSDLYLPSSYVEDGVLGHLMYFEDVSGSISDDDMIRFNSEIKYIKDKFQPEKMTLVQFDTKIQSEIEYKREDPFEHVVRKGCGGTTWQCVHQHIVEKRPSVALIFTDMGFWDPITRLPFDIPVLFVGINSAGVRPPFGQMIYIKG